MSPIVQAIAQAVGGVHKKSMGVWQFKDQEVQDFATMIAQECASAIWTPECQHKGPEYEVWNIQIRAMLKHINGVEE